MKNGLKHIHQESEMETKISLLPWPLDKENIMVMMAQIDSM